MAKTDPINPSVPAGSEDPKLGDNRIRELARGTIEIFNVDHYVGTDSGSGYTEDAAGEHSKVTLRTGSAPSAAADKGFVHATDVSGKAELFYKDEDGNDKQITSAGKLNVVDADGAVVKTGDQTVAGIKTFSSFPVTPSSAPSTNYQTANKKYVDDQITANVGAPGQFHYDGTSVFSTTLSAANTWQALDLSAKVGARRALCFLKVTTTAATVGYATSPDLTGAVGWNTGYTGANQVALVSSSAAYITMMTNSDGTLKHGATNNSATITVTLLGYIY